MIDALGERVLQKDLKRLVDRTGAAGVDGAFLFPDDLPDETEAQQKRRKMRITKEQAARLVS